MNNLKYEVEIKKFSELKDHIEIPRFQRGLVWGKTKKREFIKSLKLGLPVGVLLLSQKGDNYLVIDGLQRFTTMKDYSSDFFSYIEKTEITDSDLGAIINSNKEARKTYDDYTDVAKQRVREEIREIIVANISKGQTKNLFQVSKEIALDLANKVSMFPKTEWMDLMDTVYNIVERICQDAKIDDITIPVIIFKGEEEELATVFQKLNQEGVKLSKYDVFAATWIDSTVVVKNDPKFIDYIIAKYDLAEKEANLEIADYDADELKQSGRLTVFEYAYAVGKALMDECKKLFPKTDEKKIDSIGFIILAELMGLTYSKMGALAEVIEKYDKVDFKQLKDAILEAGKIVEASLIPYIEAPTPKKASLVCHSELQLASYIIVVFKLIYELTVENGLVKNQKKNELKNVKRYIHKHYLYDVLRGFWAGSGDSKLEEIIEYPTVCRYVNDVAREDFETAISNWLKESIKKVPLTNISAESRLFLNYLLRKKVQVLPNENYDVEHCVPKNVIKKYYHNRNKVVPMSSPCNMVYIPYGDNRGKGDETYYQKQKAHPTAFTLNQEQLDNLVYPSKAELGFVESVATLTEEKYFSYLENRRLTVLNEIVKAYYD